MRKSAIVAFGVALAFANAVGTAHSAPAQSAADILQAGANAGVGDGYPGVIGLVRNGADSQYVHAGYGDLVQHVPADPQAQYRIGSDTKAFTSTVLLQLEAEGKLSLDDTVARWLPGVVNANGNDGTKITIRELLNHTSGIPDYASDIRFDGPYVADVNPNQAWTPQDLVNIATSHAPVAAPGQKWSYSNTNYVLAGMVIKAVTGNDPSVEIENRIIGPLGLHNTTFPTSDPNLSGNYLHGYFLALGIYRDVTVSQVQGFGAAGAIVSTLDDLATFERALQDGQLLPPAQEKELKTTVPIGQAGASYGLGIGEQQTPCGPAWDHTGAVLGYFNGWLTSDDGSKQVLFANNEYHMIASTPGQTDVGTAAVNAFCAL